MVRRHPRVPERSARARAAPRPSTGSPAPRASRSPRSLHGVPARQPAGPPRAARRTRASPRRTHARSHRPRSCRIAAARAASSRASSKRPSIARSAASDRSARASTSRLPPPRASTSSHRAIDLGTGSGPYEAGPDVLTEELRLLPPAPGGSGVLDRSLQRRARVRVPRARVQCMSALRRHARASPRSSPSCSKTGITRSSSGSAISARRFGSVDSIRSSRTIVACPSSPRSPTISAFLIASVRTSSARLELARLHQRLAQVGHERRPRTNVPAVQRARPLEQRDGRVHVTSREGTSARPREAVGRPRPDPLGLGARQTQLGSVAVRLLEVVAHDLLELQGPIAGVPFDPSSEPLVQLGAPFLRESPGTTRPGSGCGGTGTRPPRRGSSVPARSAPCGRASGADRRRPGAPLPGRGRPPPPTRTPCRSPRRCPTRPAPRRPGDRAGRPGAPGSWRAPPPATDRLPRAIPRRPVAGARRPRASGASPRRRAGSPRPPRRGGLSPRRREARRPGGRPSAPHSRAA